MFFFYAYNMLAEILKMQVHCKYCFPMKVIFYIIFLSVQVSPPFPAAHTLPTSRLDLFHKQVLFGLVEIFLFFFAVPPFAISPNEENGGGGGGWILGECRGRVINLHA